MFDKLFLNKDGLVEYGPITIVAFGDSVTHGALANGEIDQDTVYWNLLRKKILQIRNYVPINMINAGIGGTTAHESMQRMERQVLRHCPDLIIVCFGLNDVNEPLEQYINSLRYIFKKGKDSDSDLVFMTPNMLNTYVAEDTDDALKDYAAVTAGYQTSGRMDRYMEAAVALASSMNIPVCDCYSRWKQLSQSQDITKLLINRINHPTREMHHLFADCLFDTIFQDQPHTTGTTESTIYGRR